MKKHSMKLNMLLNSIRQCCTMIFPLITIPYISRVLGAENYGKVNFGSSVAAYFILLGAFGVNAYAIREGAKIRNDKTQYKQFASEVLSINMLTALISYCLLALLLVFWKKVEDYRLLICIQSIPIIFSALGMDWNNNVFEDFSYTTVRYIVVQIVSVILMFVFVRDRNDYLLYALITVVANVGGNVVNFFYIRRNYVKARLTKEMNLSRHFLPMLYLFSNSIATTIYVNSDITILTMLKNDEVTGIYSIAVKIYTVAKQFIYAVVGVSLPRLSFYIGQNQKENYNLLLRKILHALILIILPAMIGMIMIGKNVIAVIAGDEFVTGNIALSILACAIVFSVLSFFYVYGIMIPYGLEKKCLAATIVAAVVNVTLNFVLIPVMSLNGAALTTVLAEAIVLGLSIYYSKGLYKLNITIKEFLPCIYGCTGVVTVCFIIVKLGLSDLVTVILAVVLSCVVYGGCVCLFKDEIVVGFVREQLTKRKKRNSGI